MVYTKVLAEAPGVTPHELEYLFLVSLSEEHARIVRIIPFQFRNAEGKLERISFPPELQIHQNLDEWEREFSVEEVHLGDFLAQQLTRRVEAMVESDERIQNTFRERKVSFEYHDGAKPYFSMSLNTALRDFNNYSRTSLVFHEDMLYLLNLASKEFVDVVRSYQFGDYTYLTLRLSQEPDEWVLGRDDLELFRQGKMDLQGILSLPRLH